MIPRPMPPYVLIKLPRKNTNKKGIIITPDTLKFMAHNLQFGEIVNIGERAKEYFPELEVGYTLCIHHFVESDSEYEAKVEHLVHQTDTHSYYVVTVFDFNGKGNETYGVWDGVKLIPNKEYIFLRPNVSITPNLTMDDILNGMDNQQLKVSKSGLLLFDKWEDTREKKEERMGAIKQEIEWLSQSGTHKPHVQQAIAEKEKELDKIVIDINKSKYLPFKVAHYNKEFLSQFHGRKEISSNEFVYVLNIAASTEVKFNDVNYIVSKTQYIGYIG